MGRRIESDGSDGSGFDKRDDRILASDRFAFGEIEVMSVEQVPIGMEGTPGRGWCGGTNKVAPDIRPLPVLPASSPGQDFRDSRVATRQDECGEVLK
jgi:hypothetical protein